MPKPPYRDSERHLCASILNPLLFSNTVSVVDEKIPNVHSPEIQAESINGSGNSVELKARMHRGYPVTSSQSNLFLMVV